MVFAFSQLLWKLPWTFFVFRLLDLFTGAGGGRPQRYWEHANANERVNVLNKSVHAQRKRPQIYEKRKNMLVIAHQQFVLTIQKCWLGARSAVCICIEIYSLKVSFLFILRILILPDQMSDSKSPLTWPQAGNWKATSLHLHFKWSMPKYRSIRDDGEVEQRTRTEGNVFHTFP